MAQRIIYWFRNDLRLRDNEALFSAVSAASEILPVYVFDPRQFDKTKLHFRRTGTMRGQFLIGAVLELRDRLREKGGDLLIRVGMPENIVAQLAEENNAQYVYTSKEIAPAETRIESSLSKNLKSLNIDIKLFWMDTLMHATDLPFPIAKLPSNFEAYFNEIRDKLRVKQPLTESQSLVLPAQYEAGSVPTLQELGIEESEFINQPLDNGKAGESLAHEILDQYIAEHVKNGKPFESADPLTDTRLSDWLSLGCISARYIYNELKNAHINDAKSDPMIENLLSRDYFHWTLLRYGPRMFKPSGVKHNFLQRWENDNAAYDTWINGQTADNEVNLLMEKLKMTGFLTSSERTLCANYLVNELGVNWTWGAMYFESHLLDYEVSVNWGRWNNIAGVGEN
ncbi:deoxyribodipyrimidine photo-lyase [Dyadobacter chenwenxiniae]|uniref:Deoxyribodipyrimidine photo-lyase n=1 Tax=Dyadobacter chenwenxiniae TaxID=2906456 RepID=A0A9X1TED2_9BACT|nr:deoxyribodipyrimidine photo-lyase [Dyadobacter chenwenxiniae]MCF0061614.1 deoxyribodipyrimidine photo-lyase [Dyadobacter chenwenxiniae]UON81436.1 deoxyribodipyrimidine photo-lyase [Dyadobacter chenwenxiniae]